MAATDFTADRAHAIDASGIRKVFDLAATLKDPINLSIGLPDFDAPDQAKDAVTVAMRGGLNRYTPTQGYEPLRHALRKRLTEEMGQDPGPVLITSGVSGGLLLAILATVNPGDEVLFLDPYFVMYKQLLPISGGVAVPVDSYPSFKFDAAAVEAKITPRSKVLILGSPANPTGVTMSEADLAAAVALAKTHNLLIVYDEIYREFRYDDVPPACPLLSYENTLVMRGFSKSHGMTGWRLGYAFGHAGVLEQMTKLQQYTFVCAPSPLQAGALAALDWDFTDKIDAYRRKRDIVVEQLADVMELAVPNGAFYAFPKVPAGMTGTAFVGKAIDRNVLIIPGSVFSGQDTHVRISFATSDEKLAEGCRILREVAESIG